MAVRATSNLKGEAGEGTMAQEHFTESGLQVPYPGEKLFSAECSDTWQEAISSRSQPQGMSQLFARHEELSFTLSREHEFASCLRARVDAEHRGMQHPRGSGKVTAAVLLRRFPFMAEFSENDMSVLLRRYSDENDSDAQCGWLVCRMQVNRAEEQAAGVYSDDDDVDDALSRRVAFSIVRGRSISKKGPKAHAICRHFLRKASQASRNKSAVPPATSNSSSSLDDALAAAEALGNATEQAISGSGAATSEDTRAFQNLSSPESASVNYSEIIVDNENQPVLRPPYTQRQNKTSPIIKPIKGATPIPEPQADNITGAMRDCLLGEWNEWSECVSDGASGYEGPHQISQVLTKIGALSKKRCFRLKEVFRDFDRLRRGASCALLPNAFCACFAVRMQCDNGALFKVEQALDVFIPKISIRDSKDDPKTYFRYGDFCADVSLKEARSLSLVLSLCQVVQLKAAMDGARRNASKCLQQAPKQKNDSGRMASSAPLTKLISTIKAKDPEVGTLQCLRRQAQGRFLQEASGREVAFQEGAAAASLAVSVGGPRIWKLTCSVAPSELAPAFAALGFGYCAGKSVRDDMGFNYLRFCSVVDPFMAPADESKKAVQPPPRASQIMSIYFDFAGRVAAASDAASTRAQGSEGEPFLRQVADDSFRAGKASKNIEKLCEELEVYQMRRHSFWKQEAETRIAKQLDYLDTKGLWAGETVIVSSKDEEQERECEKEKQRDIRALLKLPNGDCDGIANPKKFVEQQVKLLLQTESYRCDLRTQEVSICAKMQQEEAKSTLSQLCLDEVHCMAWRQLQCRCGSAAWKEIQTTSMEPMEAGLVEKAKTSVLVQCHVRILHEAAQRHQDFTLREGKVVRVGRSPTNDVTVNRDGVSQFHAELFIRNVAGELDAGGLCIRDNSKNGTAVRPSSAKPRTKDRPMGRSAPQTRTASLGAAGFTKAINTSGRRSWRKALALWEDAKAAGFGKDEITSSAAVAALAACSQWRQSLSLLQSLHSSSVQRGAFAYNSGLSSCVRAGVWKQGLQLCRAMHRWKIEMQIVTRNAAATLYREIGNWQAAIQSVREAAQSALRLTSISYNSLMGGGGNTWQFAFELFRDAHLRDVECDTVSCNTAISTAKECWTSAFALLRAACAQGVRHDAITIGSGTDACTLTSCWNDALQLLHTARGKDIRIDVLGCCALAAACEARGQWKLALASCMRSVEEGMGTDTALAGAGITACSSANLWEAATKIIFNSMVDASLRVDVISFGAALHACELGGCWHSSLRIVELMAAVGIRQNVVVLGAAISSCRWASKWRWATRLQSQARIQPGQVLFNAHMGACASSSQWREALACCFQAECQSLVPDSIALSTLATACGSHGYWALAMAVDQRRGELAEWQVSDETSLGALVHAMSHSGQWPFAGLLLAEAGKGDLRPDAVSLQEVVGACAQSGAFSVAIDLLRSTREFLHAYQQSPNNVYPQMQN
ncbi:Pentatricopeptide repeat-containing protein, chloroplastic [Symbiodinium microadriaticum]|uniref:Pentatricopeptide repeat-containing protein, chloroplastic n=1 Tax=Symbiodinium microadriaticum TaxID=2951 RepID=A0A1Q9C4L7_SYMMI|nr:Pentatricopeptide repeat-containing protein, chloroplastic [Symbiodinium microadriaticum]